MHIRRYEPEDKRAVRRLYLKNGYREVERGSVGPFDCIYYERCAVA